MFQKHAWRFLQIIAPIVVFVFLLKAVPSPTLVHSLEYREAKEKCEAYQLAPDDQVGVETLCASANQLVDEAVGLLPTIKDPVARLTQLQEYRGELQIILSRHPLYPALVFDRQYYNQMDDAAGLIGVLDTDLSIIQAAQNHPEIFTGEIISRELMKTHGIGFTESSRITVPYYTLAILRFLFIGFLAGWFGVLVTAIKMFEFGYNPIAVAQRELGSWQAILLIAPFANLFAMEHYDDPNQSWYSDGVALSYFAGNQHEKPEIRHTSRILSGIESIPQIILLMIQPIWKGVTWKDPVRLSLKFRYATVASLAIIINVLVVTGAHAGTIEEYTYIGDDGAVSWSTRFLLPDPKNGTWQIDCDLISDNNSITAGYRWPWQNFGSDISLQPRFLLVSNNGDITAAKIQGLMIGTAGDHPWYFFSSLKIPDGRTSIYNEFGLELSPGEIPISAIITESHSWNRSANWRFGPELRFSLGDFTLKVFQGFGLGGTSGETRVCLVTQF